MYPLNDNDLERLIDKIILEAEHGDRELFDSLSDSQRDYLSDILNELTEEAGQSPLLNLLWEIDYKEKPVDINTFLKDPYYMGNFYDQLYPKWRDEELPKIFSDPNIWQLVFTGAIGGGKTFCGTLAQVYSLYKMSCLRSPHRFYGLSEGSPIVIGLFNVFKYKVETSAWGYMEAFVEKCPYFKEKWTRDPKKTTEILFPNNIQVIAGSSELHALGNNIFGCVIDEVDFMKKAQKGEEDEVGQAYKLHNALIRRMKSRFMIRGAVPGLLIVCSSKTSQSGYVENLVNEQRRNPDPSMYIVDEPIWGYKPSENYSGEKFKIFVGDKYRSAKILINSEEESELDRSSIVEVPVEHKQDFIKDIDMAIRDVAGIATYSIRPFIPDREMIYKCVDQTRQHPFTRMDLPITIEDLDTEIIDYLDYRKILAVDRSSYKPLVNPGAQRFIHIDIGLTEDALGFCMGHISHNEIIQKTDDTGFTYTVKIPHIYIDLALRLVPNGSRIDLQKMRNFVYAIRDFGFKIHTVTLDGFQCFTGDTKISLLDGRELSFEEIHKEFGENDFWVYSYDQETNKIVPGKARSCRKTGSKEKLLEITLDNNEIIKCTHDHLFMLRNGEYIEAQNLKPQDSLMPLYRSLTNKEDWFRDGYEKVLQPDGFEQLTHHMVRDNLLEMIKPKTVCHHIDFNPRNNDPSNLLMCSWSEHKKIHASTDKHKKQATKNLMKWNKSDEHRRRMSIISKARCTHPDPEKRPRRRRDITYEMIEKVAHNFKNLREIGKYLGCDFGLVKNRIEEQGHDYYEWRKVYMPKARKKSRPVMKNHKVISIKEIPGEDVWDITVEKYNNFALSAGVFVHNSEDSVQQFIKAGFTECKVLSVDRKETPYILLRQAILENRISYYEHPTLILELSNLQRDADKKKIDHPREMIDNGKKVRGSKDLADAVAGTVFHAMRYAESIEGQAIPSTPNEPKKTPAPLGNPNTWLIDDYDNIDEIVGLM